MILAQTGHEIYNSEPVAFGIFACFLNFDNCQPEAVSDAISGAVVEPTGMKAHIKFGDSRSNRSQDIRLPPHFVTNNDDDAG